jgi:hypothetical protein
MALTIQFVEEHFARCRELCLPPQRIYAETGRYKPFSMPTIRAAQRRGYRVVKLAQAVYEIHDKQGA